MRHFNAGLPLKRGWGGKKNPQLLASLFFQSILTATYVTRFMVHFFRHMTGRVAEPSHNDTHQTHEIIARKGGGV